ncbi:MAG TPA: cobalamin-independent methionine synthase II family protein [Chloroflexota bacterium]|nr:cobalamin-independent methionine synthase II family protein [Chloroflexota bacterium]HZU05112.1 cobalamin-independent methionine synthase II family protein [Chloroflexota bacterium]
MKRSSSRILTTHAGSLPRPDDLRELLAAKGSQQPYDEAALAQRLQTAVADVVRQQHACGIDIVNDGELSKPNFSSYAQERLSGFEVRQWGPGEGPPPVSISGRDRREFPEYFATRGGRAVLGTAQRQLFCTAPLRYIGHAAVQADIARLRAALQGVPVEEAFMTAVAPGTIEHWLGNEYYPSDEAFLYAIADAMHEEYKAIVDAGFVLQIDDPDLADAWQIHPDMSVAEYRKYAELRIDALNHALRDLPSDRVRFHVCWGSYHGPHKHDIPLRDIVDLLLKVRAEAYSIEASNPCHEHEWRVWEEVKLPEGKILIPGVVGHYSDFIEHPELIAERLVRYAQLVGRENVIAGTDCGLGGRVGHPTIVWAKFQALAEGARLASRQLWG